MHATCLDDETLAGYADGSLRANGRAAVDKHVDRCHTCRRLLAAVGASSDADGVAPGYDDWKGDYEMFEIDFPRRVPARPDGHGRTATPARSTAASRGVAPPLPDPPLARLPACPTPEEPWQTWLRACAGRMASRCTTTPSGA
jgi:hypothetical protein